MHWIGAAAAAVVMQAPSAPAYHVLCLELEPGAATIADATALLGEPDRSTPVDGGRFMVEWSRGADEPGGFSLAILLFDAEGVLIRVSLTAE